MRIPSFLLSYAFFFAAACVTNAQTTILTTDIPRTISYQGLLANNDGTPFIDGHYQVTVGLYSDEQGSIQVWKETYTTQVKGGVFNLYLGSGRHPLPEASVMNVPLWIGTTVNGEAEMRPLTPLSASPYALNVADKAITADKVDMDYISELRIDGEKISGKGTVLNLMSTPGVPLRYDEATQSVMIGRAGMQTGDHEKGAGILANPDQVWSANGDGWDIGGGGPYVPGLGDWLGTSTGVDLMIKVNSQQVMQYQQTGISIPNIIGGQANTITAATSQGSIIAEGTGNNITNGNYNAISGGETNGISNADYSAVAGGQDNSIANGLNSFIGGGEANSINLLASTSPSDHAVIAGGRNNAVTNGLGFIGGGLRNRVDGAGGAVVGGGFNIISAIYANNFIGGGGQNEIVGASGHSTIGGGVINKITNSWYSSVGAGEFNTIDDGDRNTICAGSNNHILNTIYTTISGGFWNVIDGSDYSTIGGGEENRIMTAGTEYATISGGRTNTVQGSYGTIPGGDQLLVNASYAQTAVGFFNAPRGSMAVRPSAATIAASNNPLFMVGNGSVTGGTRSNAFEVSYNGHSVVYGKLGNSPGPSAIEGATYADNVVYGWGLINGAGGILSGFGIGAIAHVAGSGIYTISLNITDPAGVALAFTNLAVTATLNDNSCAFINVVRNAAPANTFTVNIHNATCLPIDLPFTFHVTGRR